MQLNNLNIAVLGAGRSGRAAARLAMTHGARVCVFDASSSIDGWPEDIPLHTAATEEDGRAFHADLVVISPGIETDSPFVKSFGREGVETIGEMELACRFYHGRIIAITGTNGKTTTTSLVEKILLRAGKTAVACGNYGVPVAEILLRDSVPDVLALEVSSFQLETSAIFTRMWLYGSILRRTTWTATNPWRITTAPNSISSTTRRKKTWPSFAPGNDFRT